MIYTCRINEKNGLSLNMSGPINVWTWQNKMTGGGGQLSKTNLKFNIKPLKNNK